MENYWYISYNLAVSIIWLTSNIATLTYNMIIIYSKNHSTNIVSLNQPSKVSKTNDLQSKIALRYNKLKIYGDIMMQIFSFTFCYQLNVNTKYYKRNVIIVFYCLLIFIHSPKKVQNAKKLIANLTAQISDGFKE